MSNHAVIITDLNRTRNDIALFDVCTDDPSWITYTVFGVPNGSLVVPANGKNFATSGDLFALNNDSTSLVTARTADPSTVSAASLRQKKLVMSVPPTNRTFGTAFSFPLGDPGTDTFVLIGNPGGGPATGTVRVGPPGGTISGNLAVQPGEVQVVPISAAESRVSVNIDNGVQVIVQVLVNGHGQEFSMTIVPPTA